MAWQQVPSSRPPCRTQSKLAAGAEEERETEPCARHARAHHFQPAATARFAWGLTGGDAGHRVPTPRHKARSRIARSAGLPAALAVLALFGGVWAGAAGAGSHAPEPVAGSRRLLGHGPRSSSAARGPPGAFTGPSLSPTFGLVHLRQGGLAGLLHKLPSIEVTKISMPKLETPRPSLQGVCNLAAGGIAGAVASAITCPLEVIKTNLQARANVGSGLNPASMAAKIVRDKGPAGLYRGLSLSLMGIIPTRSCYFWAYGSSKGVLAGVMGDGPATHMLSAVAAGGLSSTVTCPLWMVKTRMQLEGGGLVHTARAIVAENGVKGLYRGLKASYWGLSEGALQFFLYEKAKRVMMDANARADGRGELRSWQYLVAAGGSKGIASLATYPHEVVRTRMREAGSARYQKMLQSLALIAREEGAKGLYGGLGPHLLRVVPNTAIMFMSFEVLSKSLPGMVEQRAWETPLAQGRRAVQGMYGKAREGVVDGATLLQTQALRLARGRGSIA